MHNGQELPDLLSAMVLADLLATEERRVDTPSTSPPKAPDDATEIEQLRVTVSQLEHALHTRVVVEQAIGVLSERHALKPREAFQRLRSAARSRGRKVADLAREVITSSTAPSTPLPGDLAAESSTSPS
ncbi:hypothetical protein F4561_000727 [Lipingzhangella halophila]|uniref:ANTAR domain-containing protein n=1 Tax=Lipingzhangella halophila TaxID=1783352 RepID=A0A7W7W0H4_9ACTN|nr:hypothetical protein [Lipingzhangella halophila]